MTRRGRDLTAEIVVALSAPGRGPLKAKELSRTLAIPTHEYRAFRRLLTGLEKAGTVERVRGHRYRLTRAPDLVTGTLSLTRRGDGFLRRGGGRPDVFIPSGSLGTAMDGDRVAARIERTPKGRSPVGAVMEVVARARRTVVGTLHRGRRSAYVTPLDGRFTRDVVTDVPAGFEASDGDVVVVLVRSYGDHRTAPTGVVETVLGPLSDPGVDVLAVAYGFDPPLDFPEEVVAAAHRAAREGEADRGAGRVDRTDLLCFTVDPADAKDHDDALSLEIDDDGTTCVGVHIADVSHFVGTDSPVDIEAASRGTSVYLVDRAIPMLPAELSAGVCSLKEGVDRCALSLFITLDPEGRVLERRYERTLIRCARALSYAEAQGVLDGDGSVDPPLDAALRRLDDLARKIRSARHERGALDLDLPEARVVLDEDGTPVDIQRRERLASHRLVEDYMLLANEVVAGDLLALGAPGLFRVHEPPSSERVQDLADALSPLGLKLPRRTSLVPRDIQTLVERVHEPSRRVLVSTLVLRALSKARYDVDNVGHFGLASPGYTHFTSPIRRYPDLIVHRILVGAFLGGPAVTATESELSEIADRSSQREQAAEAAERATVALKKVQFMERHLGDTFSGRISGITSFGAFVTLDDFFVDGLVHVRSMEDDYYSFDTRRYALVGERGGRRYGLGDRLLVQVVRVDKEARHIDFLAIRKLPPVD